MSRPRVALTQAQGRLEELGLLLEERGFEVLRRPLIQTAVRSDARTRTAAATLASLPWLLLASRAAVSALVELGVSLAGTRCGAVGPATAAAIEGAGGSVAVTGIPHDAAGLARAFLAHPEGAGPVGLPRGNRSQDTLQRMLGNAGIAALPLVVYDTIQLPWADGEPGGGDSGAGSEGKAAEDQGSEGQGSAGYRHAAAESGGRGSAAGAASRTPDVVVLASPSAVEALPDQVARGARLVTLGATTTAAARARGWTCEEAVRPTPTDTLAAVERVLT